jgi:uncharacterized coiled-coil DUF342 family protein
MSEGNGDGGIFSAGTIIGLIVGIMAFLVSAVKTIFSIQDLKAELKEQNDKIDGMNKEITNVKNILDKDVKNVFVDIKEHSADIVKIGNKIVELTTRMEFSEKYRNDINRGFKWLDEKEGSIKSDNKQKRKSKDNVSPFEKHQQDHEEGSDSIENGST